MQSVHDLQIAVAALRALAADLPDDVGDDIVSQVEIVASLADDVAREVEEMANVPTD